MYSSEYLTLRYLPGPGVLQVSWLAEPPPGRARLEYTALLRAAFTYDATRWLIDLRRRPHLHPETSAWAMQQWMPLVIQSLEPKRLRMAFVVWLDRNDLMHENPALRPALQAFYDPERSFDTVSFFDEHEALAWLCDEAAPITTASAKG